MGTSADVAPEFQGRRYMEGHPADQRSSTGNRACAARFVFSGRRSEDDSQSDGNQAPGTRTEALSALLHRKRSCDLRTGTNAGAVHHRPGSDEHHDEGIGSSKDRQGNAAGQDGEGHRGLRLL